jgi:hypothetical protein
MFEFKETSDRIVEESFIKKLYLFDNKYFELFDLPQLYNWRSNKVK